MDQNAAFSDAEVRKTYNRRVRSWTWYDWADHAYITTTASAFFPPYFIAIAAAAFLAPGAPANDVRAMTLARDTASNVFALAVSFALLVAAILAPILGTLADITGRRKQFLIYTTICASLVSSLMFTLTTGMWVMGLVLYFISQVAMNIALGLSSSLLPHVARADDMERVSSLGYAMGYVGGGLLLGLNTVLFLFADKLGMDSSLAVRIAFLSVGIWWLIFTIPLMRNVPSRPPRPWRRAAAAAP
jgi:MFS transporter, UMF1 family